jgi:hypothetical protein
MIHLVLARNQAAIAAWHYATEYSANSALLQAAVAATLTDIRPFNILWDTIKQGN